MNNSFFFTPPPKLSGWKCHLFGGSGIVWEPVVGQVPSAWSRYWQRVFFGNRWVRP